MATATPHSVQTLPTARILHNTIRENRDHGFIYLNNPRVGCSTVKSVLWQAITGEKPAQGAHVLEGSPFNAKMADAAFAERAFIFTFVRNPYHRVYPFVKPNLIADLGAMDSQMPAILARLFPGKPAAEPAMRKHDLNTRARMIWRTQLADAGTRKRVQEIYGADFEAFGYRTDLEADPDPIHGPRLSAHGHEGLGRLAAYLSADGPGKATALRMLEQGDSTGALTDWVLAQRLRLLASNRDRTAVMLTTHAAQIVAGPNYLQRIAEQVRLGPPVKGQDHDE